MFYFSLYSMLGNNSICYHCNVGNLVIKYFVSHNEILLVLTDRPTLFVKTVQITV